jgi:hypothetical protein
MAVGCEVDVELGWGGVIVEELPELFEEGVVGLFFFWLEEAEVRGDIGGGRRGRCGRGSRA